MIKKFGIIVLSIVMIFSAVAFSGCTEEKTYRTELDPSRITAHSPDCLGRGRTNSREHIFYKTYNELSPGNFEIVEYPDMEVLEKIKVLGVKYELEYLYSGHAYRYDTEMDVYKEKGVTNESGDYKYNYIIVNRHTGKADRLVQNRPELNDEEIKTEEECLEIATELLSTKVKSFDNYNVDVSKMGNIGYYISIKHKNALLGENDDARIDIMKDGTIYAYDMIGLGSFEDIDEDGLKFTDEEMRLIKSRAESFCSRKSITPDHSGGVVTLTRFGVDVSTPYAVSRDLDGNLVVFCEATYHGEEVCTVDDQFYKSPHSVTEYSALILYLGYYPY